MRVIRLAALLVAFMPASGFAGWQWSHWGMLPDQLVGASHGLVLPFEPEAGDFYNDNGTHYYPRARFSMDFAGVGVNVVMLFDAEDRLAMVRMDPAAGTSCAALEAAASRNLGTGIEPVEPTSYIRLVHWRDGDDLLVLFSSPPADLCHLTQRPAAP